MDPTYSNPNPYSYPNPNPNPNPLPPGGVELSMALMQSYFMLYRSSAAEAAANAAELCAGVQDTLPAQQRMSFHARGAAAGAATAEVVTADAVTANVVTAEVVTAETVTANAVTADTNAATTEASTETAVGPKVPADHEATSPR